MTRKETTYNLLRNLTMDLSIEDIKAIRCGFDAQTIALKAQLDRTNVSRDLNELTSEGKVIKIKGRPVLFLEAKHIEELLGISISESNLECNSLLDLISCQDLKSKKDHLIDKIIGADGSLMSGIYQAKASVMYPHKGLNIMITGATGVGKTTFAELIYQYSKNNGRINKNAKFVEFNCSEYAENPQLLSSHIFGHAKGAFTGAERDKAGLVEDAEGGILLLDEIHRLTHEGQEMLFMLIDKGIYRRLGEAEIVRKANVLIIGATTEDLNSSLLKTFIRRFPTPIHIPSLEDRPLYERYEIINNFFSSEAEIINVKINVARNVILYLMSYPCPGNIGQLKGDIQLLCARGFLDYATEGENEIFIGTNSLPNHINGNSYDRANKIRINEIGVIIGDQAYFNYTKDFHIDKNGIVTGNDRNLITDDIIGMVILSHNIEISKNIADKINAILKTPYCKYASFSFGKIKNEEEVYKVIKESDRGKGVLVLSDIDDNRINSDILMHKTDCIVSVIENISVQIAVEIAKKVIVSNHDIFNLSREIKKEWSFNYSNFSINKIKDPKDGVIITTCLTGEGSAEKIATLIKNGLPELQEYNISVIPMNLNSHHQNELKSKNIENIIAVVGTVDLSIEDVPYIPLDEFILRDGIERISEIIQSIFTTKQIKNIVQEEQTEENKIIEVLKSTILFLDPHKTYKLATESFIRIRIDLEPKRRKSLEVRYILHVACMLERVIQKLPLDHPRIEQLREIRPIEFEEINRAMEILEYNFNLKVTEAEKAFIVDLVYTQ